MAASIAPSAAMQARLVVAGAPAFNAVAGVVSSVDSIFSTVVESSYSPGCSAAARCADACQD